MNFRSNCAVQALALLAWCLLDAVSTLAFTNINEAYNLIGFDPSAPGNAVVIQMSDQHMCLKIEGSPAPVPTTNLHPLVVSSINSMVPPPDKIIITGDVSSDLSSVPGHDGLNDPVGYRWATNEMGLFLEHIYELTNVVRSNIVWIPGNHDQSSAETNAETFCRMFPDMPTCQAFDLGGLRFFLINSGNYCEASASQREWLRQQAAATSPTQPIVVATHQPSFNGIAVERGVGLLLRELFGDWKARWWVLAGHTHCRSVDVFNVGRSKVMQIVSGPASTNTFVGFSPDVGYRVLCLSNGIVGQIYYYLRTGGFELQSEPDWETGRDFTAAFERIPGLLWRRLKGPALAPEVLLANAFDSITWWGYTRELQLALPLAQHANRATHFLLLASGLSRDSSLDFSADRTNWIRVLRPPDTNCVYSFPIPPEIACLATGYVRFLGVDRNDWIGGWGLASTNTDLQPTFPRLAHTPNQAVALGQVMTVTNVAIDPYSPPDELQFTLLSAPAGASLDRQTGVLSWQPTNAADIGNALITVRVADTGTPVCSATQTFRVTVVESNGLPLVPSNSPPVLPPFADQTLGLGMSLRLALNAADPDWDILTYQLSADAPKNSYLDPISNVLTWTPSEEQLGTNRFSVTVTDSGIPQLSATQNLTFVVVPPNHSPSLAAIPDQELRVGAVLAWTNSASDPDGDSLTFLLGAGAPTNAHLNPVTGTFTWAPTLSQVGYYLIEVQVNDSGAPMLSATQQFYVIVKPELEAPRAQLALKDGNALLSVSGAADLAYTIEASTNLSDWEVLCTTNALTVPFEVEDRETPNLPRRFYRVQAAHRVWDPDVQDFYLRADLTDPSLHAAERQAVEQLVLGYKASGLWNIKDAIYPFVGSSSNACAQNLKSSSYSITFTASGITYSNGITGDGTGWGDTGLNLSRATNYQKDSGSLFVYSGTEFPSYNTYQDGLGCFLGAVDFSRAARASIERNGSAFSVAGLNANSVWNLLPALGSFRGPMFVSRVSSKIQYNGSQRLTITNSAISSSRAPDTTCAILARKSEGGSADHKLACDLRGASIGAGMTPADFAIEAALWQKFNTVLGRETAPIGLTQTARPSMYKAVGDVITYTLAVSNKGDQTLNDVTVVDAVLGQTFGPIASLEPGATTNFNCARTITQADLDTGSVFNSATVTAYANGTFCTDSDTKTVNAIQAPSIDLTTIASPTNYTAVGNVITYTLAVTNTGNVTLTNITIADAVLGQYFGPIPSLAPRAGTNFTCTRAITQADLDAHTVFNSATATGYFKDGAYSDTDSATATTTWPVSITLIKTATPTTYTVAGELITYTLAVTNTGIPSLTNITVEDTALGQPLGTIVKLDPGEGAKFSFGRIITQADLDAGSLFNSATATGYFEDRAYAGTDSTRVTAIQAPSIDLLMTASPTNYATVGEVVIYWLGVTNTGNVTLTGITVDDPTLGQSWGPIPRLAPGLGASFSLARTITQADLDAESLFNAATATGYFNDRAYIQTDSITVSRFQALPPMGINTWNGFGISISEAVVSNFVFNMNQADAKSYGYTYVNLDDGFFRSRADDGTLQVDTNYFPHGPQYIADLIRSNGYHFGIYFGPGSNTSSQLPVGSRGHLEQDVALAVSLGSDYFKMEAYDADNQEFARNFLLAWRATGHPVFANLSAWSLESWMPETLSSWHITGNLPDPNGDWDNLVAHFDILTPVTRYQRPGHFSDLGLETVFRSAEQYKAQWTMFCLVSSPILLSSFSGELMPYRTNRTVIAVDQDPAVLPPFKALDQNGGLQQVWCKPLGSETGARKAVGILNRDTSGVATVTVAWPDIGLPDGPATVIDAWAQSPIGYFTNAFTTQVTNHSMPLFVIEAGCHALKPGTNFLSQMWWMPNATNLNLNVDLVRRWYGWIDAMFDTPIFRNVSYDGQPLTIRSGAVVNSFTNGIQLQCQASLRYFLGGHASRFHTEYGMEASAAYMGATAIQLVLDGTVIYDSGEVPWNTLKTIDVSVAGGMVLTINCSGYPYPYYMYKVNLADSYFLATD